MVTSLSEALAGLRPQETKDTAAAPSKQPSGLNAGAAEWRPSLAAAAAALRADQHSAQCGLAECNTDASAAEGDWSAATHQQDDWGAQAEAAVAHLADLFPEYSADALWGTLESHGCDIAAAADELRQLEVELASQWQLAQTHQQPQEDKAGSPAALDHAAFPALSATAGTQASARNAPGLRAPWVSSWGGAGADGLKQRLRQPGSAASSSSGSGGRGAGRGAAAMQLAPGQRRQVPAAAEQPADGHPAAAPWVDTGLAVSQQYAAARDEARDHARIRNAYFQQATLAYQTGNKALAKELGAKGRAANEAMKAAHAAASSGIFASRNAGRSHATAGRSGRRFLDLHGQHVPEALAILEAELSSGSAGSTLQILVGAGHHTKVARARLPAAVEKFLSEQGLTYRQSQPGLLEVRIL